MNFGQLNFGQLNLGQLNLEKWDFGQLEFRVQTIGLCNLKKVQCHFVTFVYFLLQEKSTVMEVLKENIATVIIANVNTDMDQPDMVIVIEFTPQKNQLAGRN